MGISEWNPCKEVPVLDWNCIQCSFFTDHSHPSSSRSISTSYISMSLPVSRYTSPFELKSIQNVYLFRHQYQFYSSRRTVITWILKSFQEPSDHSVLTSLSRPLMDLPSNPNSSPPPPRDIYGKVISRVLSFIPVTARNSTGWCELAGTEAKMIALMVATIIDTNSSGIKS